MDQRGQGRYDRSRYGTDSQSKRTSGRYHDTFYEDMLIPEDGPLQPVSKDAEPDGEPTPVRRTRFLDDEEYADEFAEEAGGFERAPEAGDTAGRRARSRYGERTESNHDADWVSDEQGLGGEFPDENGAFEGEGEEPERVESDKERMSRTFSRKSVEDRIAASASEKRAPKKRKVVLGVVAAVVLAVVLVGAGVGMAYFAGISGNLHAGVDDDLRAALVETDMAKEPFYLLLLGTDGSAERDKDPFYGGGYRSDSIMLARIDPVQKKATLVSIGRDMQVDLGGEYGEQKINAAYAFGGPAMAVEAVSKFAGVPISHYAQVDFDGFSAMVDALGGVDVDVPMAIVDDYDAGGSVPGGPQTLTGEQALILCRARNSYTYVAAHPDEMRAANQRLVLSAIAKKLLASDIATIASTVRAMSSYVTTDLELTDIIGLAQIMKGLNPDTDIYTASVPSTSEYVNDVWYEFVNKDEWNKMMKRIDSGQPPVEEAVVDEATGTVLATAGAGASSSADKQAIVTVKNGTEISGVASKLRQKFTESGFVNVSVGDIAQGYQYPNTLVIYDEPGRAREAQELVSIMGQGQAMQNDGSYLLLDSDFLVVIGDDWDTSL